VPSSAELLAAFAVIGFTSFGGWLAYFHDSFVEKRHWLSNAEYLEGSAIASFVPGASFLNFAIYVSHKLGGWPIVIPSILLILVPGTIGMLVLSIGYGSNLAHLPVVVGALRGLAAAAAALVALTPVRLLSSKGYGAENLSIAAAAFAALIVFRLPMLFVVPPLLIVAVWLNRKEQPA
jgi:chromate transporter